MTGMREQIARVYFEREKANNLLGLEMMNGGRSVRRWEQSDRVQRGAILGTTWESIEQRDRDGYLATADVALGVLRTLTPEMLTVTHDNPDWGGSSAGHHASEEKAFLTMWHSMLDLVGDRK